MRKILIIFSFIIFTSCNNITMMDVYKENLPIEIRGTVQGVEQYKGGGVLISVDTIKEISIGLDNKFFKNVKEGDFFIKIKNSNKCIIERNDSIIYLDCYDIPKNIRDSLKPIEEWPSNEKGYWKTIK